MLKIPIARCIVLFITLTALLAGCSRQVEPPVPVSSTVQGESTAPASCLFSLSPSSANYTASDSTGSVMVNTSVNCSWIASSDASWISITGSSSGRGSGIVTYRVIKNTTNFDRAGTIKVMETDNDGTIVLQQVNQSAAVELHLRGAYTFVLEIDPNGTCGWPKTKFYWPVFIKETSFAEGITMGSMRFPATAAFPSSTWSISVSSTQTELVPGQQSFGLAGEGYEVVVDGGSWAASGLSQAPDGRGEIKGGTVSGAMQTLTQADSGKRWECQSEANWSLIIRYTDKD